MRYPFEPDSSGDKLVTVAIVIIAMLLVIAVVWWMTP